MHAAVPRGPHALRPRRQRQGRGQLSADLHLAGEERNGVLCYDPIGQGERMQLLDREGKPMGHGNTTEHTMAGIGALLVGRSTAALPRSGTASAASITSPAGPRSMPAGWAARATRAEER